MDWLRARSGAQSGLLTLRYAFSCPTRSPFEPLDPDLSDLSDLTEAATLFIGKLTFYHGDKHKNHENTKTGRDFRCIQPSRRKGGPRLWDFCPQTVSAPVDRNQAGRPDLLFVHPAVDPWAPGRA